MSIVLPTIPALGTTWLVETFADVSKEKADETESLVRLFLVDFEAKYSRFKPDSIISTINRTKKLEYPDQTTLELLRLGQQFYQDTNGIFNILVGEHLLARGYDADYSFLPTSEPANVPSPLQALTISDSLVTLSAGAIDLGGYGKGFLIDRLANYLQELGFPYFLINGGGDMYATSDQGKPVTIYLEHPTKPGTYIAETSLQDQGFAASSTHKRRWKVASQEYSHIVDTTTKQTAVATATEDETTGRAEGRPDPSPQSHPDTLGIYVKALKAVTADAWATTLLISEPQNHTKALETDQITYAVFNTTNNTLTRSSNF